MLTSESIGDKKEEDRSFQDDDRYFAQKMRVGADRFIMFSCLHFFMYSQFNLGVYKKVYVDLLVFS